jgi:hypothetical protein
MHAQYGLRIPELSPRMRPSRMDCSSPHLLLNPAREYSDFRERLVEGREVSRGCPVRSESRSGAVWRGLAQGPPLYPVYLHSIICSGSQSTSLFCVCRSHEVQLPFPKLGNTWPGLITQPSLGQVAPTSTGDARERRCYGRWSREGEISIFYGPQNRWR